MPSLQSTAPSEEEEASAQAAELVAKELQAKVVPITTGQQWHEIKTRADAPMTQDKQAQILAMHEQGKSQVAIARELAIGVGEVRLVIDLYGKQRKVKRA